MGVWADPKSDLRIELSDGPADRLCSEKKVFGNPDGTNTQFKTYEFRRVTDFTSAAVPLGVYVNDVPLGPSGVTSDDVSTGYFVLTAAPAAGAIVTATYYAQLFLDLELDSFLRLGSDYLGLNDDYTTCVEGLRPAILQYGVSRAYLKLRARFLDPQSATYRLEDMPDERRKQILADFQAAADGALKSCNTLRDQYYTRQGQALAPITGINAGRVRNVAPNR